MKSCSLLLWEKYDGQRGAVAAFFWLGTTGDTLLLFMYFTIFLGSTLRQYCLFSSRLLKIEFLAELFLPDVIIALFISSMIRV